MMNRTNAMLGLVLVGGVFFGLSACAEEKPVEERPTITLGDARTFQNDVLIEFMTFVPSNMIVGGMSEPIPRMRAMPCNWTKGSNVSWEKSGVFLPGGYDVELSLDSDASQVLDAVQQNYEARSGWAVSSSGEAGERVLNLVSADGYEFYLEYYPIDDGMLLFSISSFSPCLEAPDDFDIFEDY